MARACVRNLSFIIYIIASSVLFFASTAHADVPLAAQLLSVSYSDTGNGGLQVTVNNLSGLRGITNDGTTLYLLDGNGNIVTVPMSTVTGSPGSSITVDGTVHTVGWGVDGAPSAPDLDGRGLAYSNGCIFINNDNGSISPIDLYCIDVSDWSTTQITVPSDEPLPEGHAWGYGTMIDFADGRIGKVSAYAATSSPESGYSSYIRMYTVNGTGKDATITWSHDYYMFDTENWNTDDHGIATDGTYLYRIEFSGSNLPDGDFKSWPLQESGAPSQVYVGSYTAPFSNMTYLSHDHTSDQYLMGNYAGDQFYITEASDPGPGPGNPLTPAFSTATSTTGGYTVQVTNYDSSFTWSATSTAGTASIDDTGAITVSGLSEGETATTTVSTTKTDVPNGSATISGTAIDLPPSFSLITAISRSSTTASITWTTDKDASTKIAYSVDTQYASTTAETDTSPRVESHSASLSGLLACTAYNFEVISADDFEKYSTSTASSFSTTGCPGGAIPSAATSTSVTVAGAATSTLADGGQTLTVATPANFTATSSTVTIQIQGLDSATTLGSIGTPSGSLTSAANIVFDVTALINNTTVLDSFNSPVTISYTYTAADISGLNPNSLTMYHYHDGAWLPLNNCSVNTSTDTITCSAPSFSIFALFGQPTTNSTTDQSASGGGTVQDQYSNLIAMGFTSQAQQLEEQYPYLFPTTTENSSPTPMSSSQGSAIFTMNLSLGMTGYQVELLQKYLNSHGSIVASSGPGSPGNETDRFGALTMAALKKFQKARGISATGYFGPITRACIHNGKA